LTVAFCMYVGLQFILQKTKILIQRNLNGGIGKTKNQADEFSGFYLSFLVGFSINRIGQERFDFSASVGTAINFCETHLWG
jgi:hypothetical protein